MKFTHQHPLKIAVIVAGTLGLGSCAIQTTYPQYPYPNNHHFNHSEDDDVRKGNGFPDFSPEFIKETLPLQIPEQKQDKVVKKYLCSAFVAPTLPKPPKVDLSKLSTIPANDHAAVKKLLLDNIQDMNQHFRTVEGKIKEAYEKHRNTCAYRDVHVD